MRLALYALLALPASVYACALYYYCHCYNANGKPNDLATIRVCDGYGSTTDVAVGQGPDAQIGCAYVGDNGNLFTNKGLSSCNFRVRCAEHGATGGDSSCRSKVGD